MTETIYFKTTIADYPTKVAQLSAMKERCEILTSDDGCSAKVEYFEDGIKRLTLTGTRSNFVFTCKGGYLIRLPKNAAKIGEENEYNVHVSDFLA